MSASKTQRLVETAMLIGIATVLSIFKPFELPFGGGVTIVSMLPIIIIAFRYGTAWGLFSAFTGSILQIIVGFKTVSVFFLPGDGQVAIWKAILICLIDYILAYSMLGFGGVLRNTRFSRPFSLCLGSVIALLLRYICHIISGILFFGQWAQWYFSQEKFYAIGEKILETYSGKSLTVIYSVFYNGLYMIPEIIITAIVALIIGVVPQLSSKKA